MTLVELVCNIVGHSKGEYCGRCKRWKDQSIIPKGHYCYERLEAVKDPTLIIPAKIEVINPCPYWSRRKDKPEQENGYCSYMDEGDWEDTSGMGLSLIWDQVKECGIKF